MDAVSIRGVLTRPSLHRTGATGWQFRSPKVLSEPNLVPVEPFLETNPSKPQFPAIVSDSRHTHLAVYRVTSTAPRCSVQPPCQVDPGPKSRKSAKVAGSRVTTPQDPSRSCEGRHRTSPNRSFGIPYRPGSLMEPPFGRGVVLTK